MCTHRHTNFLKINFWNNAFFVKDFLKFPSDAKFRETAPQNWEILRYVEHSAHAHNFLKFFQIFKITIFLWKIRTFLILSPLSARRNFCSTARQIFRIFKPHLWLSPQFFSDLYLQKFLIWILFVEISGSGHRMNGSLIKYQICGNANKNFKRKVGFSPNFDLHCV